ncbi:flagellar protein FliS [Solidesulfovibrio carbinoliphilus subsp. oakridgensis]|uniref:Flagellar protein FliS n=1 Tax=Solidesulfovibrio carbinoliphilus subsp. oakridgensis TaxID=694327 RepID=G7QAD2_9BACT|nr:flagellar export chaperone FliS [Solidesulfovibrio carbinoliphilus]EHJ48685.1 flagellar protein FliS [Solidesulfovibrio carbinoliphilus subsp. oakridgensis]
MQSAARSYFQTQVSTTTQGDLLIMLFDAALKFLGQAKEKMAEKNYAQKGILISKALDILTELQGTLNSSKGGELADRLQKLYFFCSSRLLTANLKMDTAKIDEVVHILTGLRDAFNEANGKVATKTVPTSATQSAGRLPIAAVPATAGRSAYQPVQAGQAPAPAKPAVATATSVAPAAPRAPQASHAPAGPGREPREIPAPSLAGPAKEPSAAPLRRVMAAYAASRPQG